jgi:hypothetical protein
MLLIFPFTALLLFFRVLRRNRLDWHRAALGSALFGAVCIVGINETLSVGHHLTRTNVAVSWAVICGTIVILLSFNRENSAIPRAKFFSNLDLTIRTLLVGVGVVVLLVGITALLSSPNQWDAMEYHLPRVTMWMSNHSVQFFPTPDYAHLIFGPWAEFAMMHTYLLWGSDRLVNLVEFLSYLGCLIGVSLIAKLLGAGPRGQIFSVVLCAGIPGALLEASGPMNTLVAAFWIVTTVAFLMSWNNDPSWFNTIAVGLSAGIAILTKGTAYVYLPFLVLACWWMGSRSSRVLFLKRSAIFLALILAVNGAQYFRCYGLTGSPLGLPFADGGRRLHWMVDHMGARLTLANVLRNISNHLCTPGERMNLQTEKLFRVAIQEIGVDPDDQSQLWVGQTFHTNHFSSHETLAGAPIHVILLLVSVGLVLWKAHEGVQPNSRWYALGLVMAFVLFCGLLRWQVWISRHHMPILVLGSALSGLVLERYFSSRIASIVAMVVLGMALLFAVVNKTRSLVPWSRVDDVYHPRAVLYFMDHQEALAPTFIGVADAVNRLNCDDIAIDDYVPQPASQLAFSPKSFYVYPIFPLIHADGWTRTVWYSGVHNRTIRYAESAMHHHPCAVICMDCANVPEKWAEYQDIGGRASVFDYIVVFSEAGAIANFGRVNLAGK